MRVDSHYPSSKSFWHYVYFEMRGMTPGMEMIDVIVGKDDNLYRVMSDGKKTHIVSL